MYRKKKRGVDFGAIGGEEGYPDLRKCEQVDNETFVQ